MKNRYLIRRFFAYYFDALISYVLLLACVYISGITTERMHYIVLMFIPIYFCYHVFSEFFFGKSLGKKILRLQIDGLEQENKVQRLKQVIVRSLFRFVPFDQVSILFYEDNRMWHDMVSKTTVSDVPRRTTTNTHHQRIG